MNPDFPIIGIGAAESREDDGAGSEGGEKRLHFSFSVTLSNRSANVKATFAMRIGDRFLLLLMPLLPAKSAHQWHENQHDQQSD